MRRKGLGNSFPIHHLLDVCPLPHPWRRNPERDLSRNYWWPTAGTAGWVHPAPERTCFQKGELSRRLTCYHVHSHVPRAWDRCFVLLNQRQSRLQLIRSFSEVRQVGLRCKLSLGYCRTFKERNIKKNRKFEIYIHINLFGDSISPCVFTSEDCSDMGLSQ